MRQTRMLLACDGRWRVLGVRLQQRQSAKLRRERRWIRIVWKRDVPSRGAEEDRLDCQAIACEGRRGRVVCAVGGEQGRVGDTVRVFPELKARSKAGGLTTATGRRQDGRQRAD